MDKSIYLILVIFIIIIVAIIILYFISSYIAKKRLSEIVAQLNLVQGEHYDVVTNNGNKQLNLIYDRIAYGKNSQNGRINIYFIKMSSYRGSPIQKEIMIKYANIWKISKAA